MKSFWNELPLPILALAPMEAVTDVVFRQVVDKASPADLYFTEFTNATGWVHAGDKAIGGRLVRDAKETRVIAQLWGDNPDAMARLAIHCKDLGFIGIDINMGCPDSSAIKGGGGAHMIRTPEVAAAMITAAKKSGLPVSVKTRLGYTSVSEWETWLAFLLQQDIAALTVHLRTKKEMSKVPAHWELMPAIRTMRDTIAPETILLGNGDVRDYVHATELIEQTGIDGVMIGRGIFHNPYAFSRQFYQPPKEVLLDLLQYHLNLYEKHHTVTGRPFETLKRFFKVYIHSFDGASALREKLMNCKTTNDVRQIINVETVTKNATLIS